MRTWKWPAWSSDGAGIRVFASEIGEGNYRRHPGPIREGEFRCDMITCNVVTSATAIRLRPGGALGRCGTTVKLCLRRRRAAQARKGRERNRPRGFLIKSHRTHLRPPDIWLDNFDT